jgi:hypothetical protein
MGYLDKKLDEFVSLITPPRYLCTSCGRVARETEVLCLPRPIQAAQTDAAEEEQRE